MVHKLLCRMESLNSTKDIKGRGAHNVRSTEKLTNPDINRDLTKNNIYLIGNDDIYQKFQDTVKDVKEKYEEWNETRALNRQKTWKQYLDTSRNNVSTEFVLTAGLSFFEELKEANIEVSDYFEKQLEFFENKFPDYRIYSAIVHMDNVVPSTK